MALILLASKRFATIWTRMRINAMRHHNTVFHDVLKRLPWEAFERLVDEHGADKHVRRLTTKDQFIALLYGQLSGATSLREIVGGLESHAPRLYHVGGRPAQRSTLADANFHRPSAVFAELFADMVSRARRGLRRKIGEAVYLIDSTSLRLSGTGSDWAHFSAKACGAKLHVIHDADAERPIYAAVTAARVNDITAAHDMQIEAGATYVFDLGYYDYAWWAKLDAAGCRIVTRFKSNTPLTITAELDVPRGGNILSDRIGLLPRRQARSRKNPLSDPVREVRVTTDTGKVLRILCNDLDASARDIADLYKRRWEIEAVLPLDQADPQDPSFPRHLRERRAYPSRRRAHRLPAAAPGSGRPKNDRKPARLRPIGAHQSHAPKAYRPPPHTGVSTTRQVQPNVAPRNMKNKPDSSGSSPGMTMRVLQI